MTQDTTSTTDPSVEAVVVVVDEAVEALIEAAATLNEDVGGVARPKPLATLRV